MALEGTIKDFGLPDIFQLIGLQRKTGVLTLSNQQETVTITFENGMVVSADSSAKRLEDRLGHVLVKQGKLTRERLDEALDKQRATLQRLGHILTSTRAISNGDLKEALQVQVSQIVFKVFRWRDGEYHFAPTEVVDYEREYFTPMSSDFILMEGIRMVDEWPIIEKKIPSMDMVFRRVVEPSAVTVGSAEDGEDVFAEGEARGRGPVAGKVRLTPEEERVYRRVDGSRTVQGIIDATGLSEFEACRILFDLLNRNIISSVGRGTAREVLAVERQRPASALPGWILLVAVVAAAAAGVAVRLRDPFAVTGLAPFLARGYRVLLEGVAHSRLERLDRGVLAFQLAEGSVPRTLDEVRDAGLADSAFLRDPWGRPFHYAHTERGYLLGYTGAAGRPASASIERTLPPDAP